MNNENKGIHPTGVSSRVWIALVALCVANVVAHLMVMPSLPGQIPTHWGANGAVDGWGPSWMASALGVLPLVLLAMFCVVPRIDPKGEAYRTSGKVYQGFVIAFTLFMCVISWLGELTVWGVVPAVGSVNVLISGVVGLLFIGVGNYLPRVKQNYTLGIKTPWALANPENWRRTQRFGGACFMVLGFGLIVMGVAGSVLSSEVVAAVIAVLAFGSVGAVYVYSYLLWRKSQRAARYGCGKLAYAVHSMFRGNFSQVVLGGMGNHAPFSLRFRAGFSISFPLRRNKNRETAGRKDKTGKWRSLSTRCIRLVRPMATR